MKKLIISSVALVVGAVVSSYGQGQINFQNYNFGATALNAPVTFASDGMDGSTPVTAGWGVGSTFQANLLYQFGTMTSYAVLSQAESGASGYPTPFAFGLAGDGPVDYSSTYAGIFYGPAITIPGYSSGNISFIIQAFNGSDFASSFGPGLWRGQSDVITLASIATGTAQPTDLNYNGFTVSTVPVPEPTTLALAGLGSIGMLMAFRRKKA